MSEHRLNSVRNSLTRMPSGFDPHAPHDLDAFKFAPSGSSSPAALGGAATAAATSKTRVAQVAPSLLSSPWHTSAYVSIRGGVAAVVALARSSPGDSIRTLVH